MLIGSVYDCCLELVELEAEQIKKRKNAERAAEEAKMAEEEAKRADKKFIKKKQELIKKYKLDEDSLSSIEKSTFK